MESSIFETYNNAVIMHGRNIHKTAADIAISIMCGFPSDKHALSHCKFVLSCCAKCPIIFTPGHELDSDSPNACPEISFHVYLLYA